jgi:L,D-transpeptidase YcbB
LCLGNVDKHAIVKIIVRSICGSLIILFIPVLSFGQLQEQLGKYRAWSRYKEISQFYQLNNFRFGWMDNKNAQMEFLGILHSADSLGLNTADYQYSFFKSCAPGQALKDFEDSTDADVHFTDAAIHILTELRFGAQTPSFEYSGLKYNPSSDNDISLQLLTSLKSGLLKDSLFGCELKSTEYVTIIKKLKWFLKITAGPAFKDSKIVSRNADATNKPLLLRLYQLGITDSVLKTDDKKIIIEKVRKAQGLFDLLNDGTLRSTTIEAFNVPLKQRIEELKIGLNYLRWTEQIRQTSSVLLLNIPSAYLMIYDKGRVVLDSKVIVGKPSTPTPTLTSTVTQVILYPFWNVPYKIATAELLPSVKRDIGFLEAGNYQVLNNNGRVLDPYKINWKNLSVSYFPYHIRQSTGCDNALGLVKFEFYNPFTVYLHDTPNKGLFSFNKRYFSHGCMRVEKPVELAHLLLGRNRIAIDTLTAKGCLYQQAPKPVAVEIELAVMIIYSTVWYNREGEVKFFDDVYGKLKR